MQEENQKEQVEKENTHLIQPPSIELPEGGGAIRGIDEKFTVNPTTGTGGMTIPIATSSGRSGFGPQLTLGYDSASGNGPFGLGWSLPLPEVRRKTDKGLPRYIDGDESDTFILSGAEDLVPELEESDGSWEQLSGIRNVDGVSYRVSRYRPRIEGLFARIEHWIDLQTGESHWRSITGENVTTLYGRTAESRIADPTDPTRIFAWKICESFDDKGNAIHYRYKREDSAGIDLSQVHERNRTLSSRQSQLYIKGIKYGNRQPLTSGELVADIEEWLFTLLFDYGEGHLTELPPDSENRQLVEASLPELQPWPVRNDPFSTYRAGFEMRTYRLCQRVLMFHHFPDELEVQDYLVRSTEFRHEPNPILTYLNGATHAGYVIQPDGTYWQKRLPLLEFEFSQVPLQDGLQPEDAEFLQLRAIDKESLENLPIGLSGGYQFVDLDGEGVSGILTEQANHWFYKPNLGNGRFGSLQPIASQPSLANLNGGQQQLLDLAGDGQLDLVMFSGAAPGFYERTQQESWADFKPFHHLPNLDWSDPAQRFVDLTGDGHADVLITEDHAFTWYPSLAEAGFGQATAVYQALDEEQGPRLVFSDSVQAIFLTDLSGDGLVDLARIRNGDVCYWPNLGYGRFGAKVTMDNAPWFDYPEQFDHSRLRLADIDGSGIADLIYLAVDGVNIYFNQAGNGWSDGQTLTQFPTHDNQAAVQVTDLLGNGTACLVWSSPLPGDVSQPLRYVDLMNGVKPHLMIGARNNLGAETRMHYVSSTQFYLADKAAGKPWITRLPFPVHVVERVETFDHISQNRFVSRYAYHHGYFDGVEREFRGFGMVEQWDTEAFATLTSESSFPLGENIDAASHVPPVYTKSWFHTGVYVGREHVSNFFAGLLNEEDLGEYFREEGLADAAFAAQLLPDTVLPAGLSVAEEREACRALKGALLRQEVYALDKSAQSHVPYIATESNMTLRLLQPQGPNKHAVFFPHERESLSYHYERNTADPRISHSCILDVDDFGNVERSVAIGYGRFIADNTLSIEDRMHQAQLLATLSENEYTNAIDEDDTYRNPAQWSARTFELTGLPDLDSGEHYRFAELRQAADEAMSIAYEANPTDGAVEKRLLEELLTRFRADDMMELLPLGVQESLALPGESYQFAFSQNQIDLIFDDKVSATMLVSDGRYVHLSGSTDWYIPSGRIFFSPDVADSPAQEVAFAQEHFFLPQRFRDPFEETTTVTYDDHDMLLTETRDPIGNEARVVNNYRVLQALQITDPNGNRTAVSFDALGLVAGTAVMGTPAELIGDSLDNFQPDLTDAQIAAFLADPKGSIAADLLMDASTRIIYDVDRFQIDEVPSVAATLTRETHASEPLPPEGLKIQVSIGYSDGFGREIQKKVQAETKIVEINGVETEVAWVGSGWTIFNNKGKPVRQYEPFFSDTHDFEFAVTVGVSPILFYDPLERVVATVHPNHTFEKVVFDPWQQTGWDVNDTVLIVDPASDPDVGSYFSRLEEDDYLPTWHSQRINGGLGAAEQDAAQKTEAHANTPTTVYFDSLGRPFLSIADNGPFGQYRTRTVQDIEGITKRVVDARGNGVMVYEREMPANSGNFTNGSDVAGRQLYQNSMDGGERWLLPDIAGKPLYQWDSRDHRFHFDYDALQRPTHRFVRRGQTPEMLYERLVYGEAHPEALEQKLRGQLYQLYDGAGVVTNEAYDFKGNLRRGTRRLARAYKLAVDWSVLANTTDISAIEASADPFLESETFATEATFDALNRPISQRSPDQSLTLIGYNDANLLETVTVHLQGAAAATPFVTNIDYDTKGQRERIVYGNGATTTYTYDPETFRLTNLFTGRGDAFPNDCPNPPHPPCGIQNLRYAYDSVGNIISIRDEAQQTVFFANQVVEPHNRHYID